MKSSNIESSNLKTILHSQRAHIFYIEHCKVVLNNGVVEYLTSDKNKSMYYNIPIANTSFILLGPGTSITQSAIRELSRAGVLIGFCGGDGFPLYATSSECDLIDFISPESEYRPTQYVNSWVTIFFDETKRLKAAKLIQLKRVELVKNCWQSILHDISYNSHMLDNILDNFSKNIDTSCSIQDLLLHEARATKGLYKILASTFDIEFSRKHRFSFDITNNFLDNGNYLAYGVGATAAWVLGIPFSFAVLHGKTRRGGLVFDLADIFKDAVIMPTAFRCANRGDSDSSFRATCIQNINEYSCLNTVINHIKYIIDTVS